MALSAEEKALRKHSAEILCEQSAARGNPISMDTSEKYIRGVQGKLTKLVRNEGLLESESLLKVESMEEKERIRDGWLEKGASWGVDRDYKSYMEKFITVFWGLPLERIRVRTITEQLKEPLHGIRLQTLFYAMGENRNDDKKRVMYESLFCILRRNYDCYFDSNCMKEGESGFRAARREILGGMQEAHTVCKELEEIFFDPNQRARMYRDAVYECIAKRGGQILWDLGRRRLPFEKSILAPMVAIHAHPTGDDTASMLELIRLVLEDSNAQGGREDPTAAPGAALTDPRLWESGLLDPWLEKMGGAADRFAALVLHARALSKEKETLIRAEELYAEAISLAEKNWESMKKALPQESWWPEVPAEQVEHDFDRAVYPAALRIARAEVLTAMAGTLTDLEKDTRHYWLMKAREDLRRARIALQQRMEERHVLKEMKDHPAIYALLVRKNLCEAETHRLLARDEVEENCLADAVENYISPAREDLAQAWRYLEMEKTDRVLFSAEAAGKMEKETAHLERRWELLADSCKHDFFEETSPVLRRMALRTPGDMAVYRAEHEKWEHQLGLTLAPIPVISRPIDPESLLGAEEFEPVYSAGADSVTGKDVEGSKEPMEREIFQILGSSKTMLLQFNQIVDNRSMLMMLSVPGYRQACRKGVVALSCYGKVNKPRDYLMQALNKPGFKFSSTELYALPEGAQTIEGSWRKLMLDCLNGNNGVMLGSFPAEKREEAEFLLECYAILDECFQPADLLRYHQNNLQNQPHRELVNVPLDQVIRGRMEDLKRAGKQGEWMESLGTLAKLCEGITDRSIYDQKIELLAARGEYPAEHLEKFRELVYQCYYISNGRRSCKTILSTENDPDLILPGDVVRVGDYQLEDLYYQHCRPGGDGKVNWSDITRLAMIVRALDRRYRDLSPEKLVRKKEQETGCGFTATRNDTFLTAMTIQTASGNVSRIEPDSEKKGETLGIHRQKN